MLDAEPVCFADVSRANKRQNGPGFSDNGVAFTLSTVDQPGILVPDTVGALCADTHPGAYSGQDAYTGRLIPVGVLGDITHALTAEGSDASEDGTGRGTPIIAEPICMAPAFSKRPGQQIANRRDGLSYAVTTGEPPRALAQAFSENQRAEVVMSDVTRSLTKPGGKPGQGNPCVMTREPATAFSAGNSADAYGLAISVEHTPPLRAAESGTNQVPTVWYGYQVRRLLPVECERLQAFPDHYTRIPWRTYKDAQKQGVSYESLLVERGMRLREPTTEACPDGPRYKALGNSMCTNVIRAIGERIAAVAS